MLHFTKCFAKDTKTCYKFEVLALLIRFSLYEPTFHKQVALWFIDNEHHAFAGAIRKVQTPLTDTHHTVAVINTKSKLNQVMIYL